MAYENFGIGSGFGAEYFKDQRTKKIKDKEEKAKKYGVDYLQDLLPRDQYIAQRDAVIEERDSEEKIGVAIQELSDKLKKARLKAKDLKIFRNSEALAIKTTADRLSNELGMPVPVAQIQKGLAIINGVNQLEQQEKPTANRDEPQLAVSQLADPKQPMQVPGAGRYSKLNRDMEENQLFDSAVRDQRVRAVEADYQAQSELERTQAAQAQSQADLLATQREEQEDQRFLLQQELDDKMKAYAQARDDYLGTKQAPLGGFDLDPATGKAKEYSVIPKEIPFLPEVKITKEQSMQLGLAVAAGAIAFGEGLRGGDTSGGIKMVQRVIDNQMREHQVELVKKRDVMAQKRGDVQMVRQIGKDNAVDLQTIQAMKWREAEAIAQTQLGKVKDAALKAKKERQLADIANQAMIEEQKLKQMHYGNLRESYKQQDTLRLESRRLDIMENKAQSKGKATSIPGFDQVAAVTEQDAKKIKEESATVKDAVLKIDDLLKHVNKEGTTWWFEDASKIGQSKHSDLLLSLKEIAKLGVLTGPDMGLMENVMGDDPGAIRTDAYVSRLRDLKDRIVSGLQVRAQQYNYRMRGDFIGGSGGLASFRSE